MSGYLKYVSVFEVCQGICSMSELVKYVRASEVCQS